MRTAFVCVLGPVLLGAGPGEQGGSPEAGPQAWRQAEAGVLAHHVRLTSPAQFQKAGEAYFSPDGGRIIFQAIEVPPPGEAADEFYAMYVADLEHDHAGRITGLGEARRISPPGSFNTCGWFHPTDPGVVIFASTIERPMTESPGYQRSGRSYRWRFPEEMNIYRLDLDDAAGGLEPLAYDPEAYLAECSLTGDARHLLYCSLASNDGDLYIKDLATGGVACIVSAKGYDGGPFFSPDGRRICYRSDRRGDDLLQIFVGELAFDESGTAVGLKREYQLTDNGHVNFAPYWHPEGRKIAYVSSELGHHNYEIFLMDADPGNLPGSDGTIRYGTARRRITAAAGFDGFPAFNADGSKLMWTSQRAAGDAAEKRPEGPGSQVWVADFVLDTEPE